MIKKNIIYKNTRAAEFAKEWKDQGFEKGDADQFWDELLSNVYGIKHLHNYIHYEKRIKSVPSNNRKLTNFADAYIKKTRVLIEQKGIDISLDKKERQSDGTKLTPYQQAKRYASNLTYDEQPRWIITCNFKKFYIYDMKKREPQRLKSKTILYLKDLGSKWFQLDFLVDINKQDIQQKRKISKEASIRISQIHDALLKKYKHLHPTLAEKYVNRLCVQLVFCFYADDSGILDVPYITNKRDHPKHIFHNYLSKYKLIYWHDKIFKLFKILDTPIKDRPQFLDNDLKEFNYVDGGLFHDELEDCIPQFNKTDKYLKDLILKQADSKFDWSEINPTIFGTLFEDTLNGNQRKKNGMYYTSIENIHKVIDPLFLTHYEHWLNQVKNSKDPITGAKTFQNHISKLKFLDPACGSGNFLTETYISLRRMENEAIRLIYGGQSSFGNGFENKNIIKVSITQFYGIEKNSFAVAVAKTAMWIAKSQMMHETKNIIEYRVSFLPLGKYKNIYCGNALTTYKSWGDIISPKKLNYIISNPPYGGEYKTQSQRDEMKSNMKGFKNILTLDYVATWYKKSADMMNANHKIRTALISTNSIVQGTQAPVLWDNLVNKYNMHINFSYQSFQWKNESQAPAELSCVVIGFSKSKITKFICDSNGEFHYDVNHINTYLWPLPQILVKRQTTPICNVPKMSVGSSAADNGYLSNFSLKRKKEYIRKYNLSPKLFKRIMGSEEFLNGVSRWCLWLYHQPSKLWIHCNKIVGSEKTSLANLVHNYRNINSRTNQPKKHKDYSPGYYFKSGNKRQPSNSYIFFPRLSSHNRQYFPIGIENKNVIVTDQAFHIDTQSRYMFGVLSSIVHITWAKYLSMTRGAGNDTYYTSSTVYNTFPWPTINKNPKLKDLIIHSAQNILNVRKYYMNKDSTLTLRILYNRKFLSKNGVYHKLWEAHQINDKYVLEAYGLSMKSSKYDILTKLLKMYKYLIKHE